MNRRYFGTDGIRGLVGEHPMTPEFVLKLGWAAGRALSAERQGPVLIGKDTRLSGYLFESALQAGLASAGLGWVELPGARLRWAEPPWAGAGRVWAGSALWLGLARPVS